MDTPLIIGAGPTGLSAALFLSLRGVKCRIVDEALAPVPTSKALGVNPRTLSILEETGLSRRIIAEGRRLAVLEAHDNGRRIAKIVVDFKDMGVDYPMVILTQARTEALLTQALAARGISVERGLALTALTQTAPGVTATLTRAA